MLFSPWEIVSPNLPKSGGLLDFLVYVQITPENVGFGGLFRFPGESEVIIKPGDSLLFEADTYPEFLSSAKRDFALRATLLCPAYNLLYTWGNKSG